jgi:hypothetical protein
VSDVSPMPHRDPTRIYWEADPSRHEASARARIATLAERAESGSPADGAFFRAFVQPGLGPKLHVPKPDPIASVYSFVDTWDDEIRLNLNLSQEHWWEWELLRLTAGPDGVWYPANGRLLQPLSHVGAVDHALAAVAESIHLPISEPRRPVCRFNGGGAEAERIIVFIEPVQRALRLVFERAHALPSGQVNLLPYPFTCPVGSLEQLRAGLAAVLAAADRELERRPASDHPHPDSLRGAEFAFHRFES